MPRAKPAPQQPSDSYTIRNASLPPRFRNFAGKAVKFNNAGNRNFVIFLEDEVAVDLGAKGWPVKFLDPLPDDPTEYHQPILKVTVKYEFKKPRVVTVTSRGRTDLDEDGVHILDYSDIVKADLIIIPYHWDINGKTGVSAYLKSLFVTLDEDELEMEYADIPDSLEKYNTETKELL